VVFFCFLTTYHFFNKIWARSFHSLQGGDELPLDEMQNKEYTLYCLAIARLSIGLERPKLMPVEERVASMKQEASRSIAWNGSLYSIIFDDED